MELDDRLVIATPEGVELELTLAGLGSRFIAALIDVVIQVVVLFGVAFAVGTTNSGSLALGSIVLFLIVFAYHPLFEVLAAGRTPGKRLTGLRVVRSSGGPLGLGASALRTIVRIVDFLPALYVVGSISILVTSRNQRLGDLAADTIVVRERGSRRREPWSAVAVAPELPSWLASWDVSAVTSEELATVRSFLERRERLTADARSRLGRQLVEGLRPKVGGAPPDLAGEPFLEALALVKAARG